MADEKKAAEEAAKKAAEEKKKLDAEAAELAALEAEKASLLVKQKIVIAKAELAELKAKAREQERRDKAGTERKRRQSVTVKENGLAAYILKEKAYKPSRPGDPPGIREAGTVIWVKEDQLPGDSMLAVEPAPSEKVGFRPKG